jgi:glycogen(starch) synthase
VTNPRSRAGCGSENEPARSFSVVICTDGRAISLARTLRSLEFLTGPRFEVIVVRGPTEDGIAEVLDQWRDRVKVAKNEQRNLSISRNLGIAAAAGDVVVFLDDDAIPEPEWLEQLAVPYREAEVGGAGGFVFNPDGVTYQYRFGTVDRLGRADLSWTRAAPELCFPFSSSFPHPLGANSSFLRAALLEIGGFDEEFDYYLDETDVSARLIDTGWRIAQIEGAYVHHKFMASAIRNEARVLTRWHAVLKNHIYFGLMNGLDHHSIDEVISGARDFMEKFRKDVDWAISVGKLSEEDRTRFWVEVDGAWREGLSRGLSGQRRLPELEIFAAPQPFLPFRTLEPAGGRLCVCFLSQDYPPGPIGGIGRYTHSLAVGLAGLGHHVHVLTRSADHDRVDFEDGVWVHRLIPAGPDTEAATGMKMPSRIGAHAMRMHREVAAISAHRHVDAVYAPIWDCEGAAFLQGEGPPLIVSLQTTLQFWLESKPEMMEDPVFVRDFATPMMAMERRLLREADGLHAISTAIATDIEKAYSVSLPPDRLHVVPLGLDDWTTLPFEAPRPLPPDALRLLFVGRLEQRKGIDVLLAAARSVLARHPQTHLDIVGDDTILGPDGRTFRDAFTSVASNDGVSGRIHFHGAVSEEQLRGFYRTCDIMVTPSRFESFGLMLLEGMMFGKAVIGCDAGGMVEVVEDGVSGLLAKPGDVTSLTHCLERVIMDSDLRRRLGGQARRRFDERFTAPQMVSGVASLLRQVAAGKPGVFEDLVARR